MKKWCIFLISILSVLVILLSGILIAIVRETEEEEVIRYPVTKFYMHSGIGCGYPVYTLEEAVAEAALIAICSVTEIFPSEPVIHYDEETGEELSKSARTPAILQIETVLKGDSDRETVIYRMYTGTFIEKIQKEWFVHYYENTFPTVSEGERVLIFFTDDDMPIGDLLLKITASGIMLHDYFQTAEGTSRPTVEELSEKIRTIVAASE